MPLNPPSYIGHDVWFSPDVFVNKAQVALWQPPWPREEVLLPSLGPITIGDDIAAEGTAISEAESKTYLNNLVKRGDITQEQAVEILGSKSTPNDASNNNVPVSVPTPITSDTGGVEKLTEFPLNLPLSRYYTLGQLTQKPWVTYAYDIPTGGINGLTRGQIVGNLKLLAVNTLDKIKDKFPNMIITNTFRAAVGRSQHGRGMAADLQFTGVPKSQYYDIAIWIRDNIPFDQLLLEFAISSQGKTCWIHISYTDPRRAFGTECKVGTLVAPTTWINRNGLTNYASNIGLA